MRRPALLLISAVTACVPAPPPDHTPGPMFHHVGTGTTEVWSPVDDELRALVFRADGSDREHFWLSTGGLPRGNGGCDPFYGGVGTYPRNLVPHPNPDPTFAGLEMHYLRDFQRCDPLGPPVACDATKQWCFKDAGAFYKGALKDLEARLDVPESDLDKAFRVKGYGDIGAEVAASQKDCEDALKSATSGVHTDRIRHRVNASKVLQWSISWETGADTRSQLIVHEVGQADIRPFAHLDDPAPKDNNGDGDTRDDWCASAIAACAKHTGDVAECRMSTVDVTFTQTK